MTTIRPHRSTYVPRCGPVCHDREPSKNDWTDRDAVWSMDSGRPKEERITWGCTLAQPGEDDWTVHVRQRCGLFVKLLSPLVIKPWFHVKM